jgi:hypothetical protein
VSTPSSYPNGITTGPDGALWFTESLANKIGRICASVTAPGCTSIGAMIEYPLFAASSYPNTITSGPDGALWFTEETGPNIGRVTTAGVITEYPVLTAHSSPFGITTGPDGALWFTENGGHKIGRITTSGTITEYLLPSASGDPDGITTGPDGALWFAESGGNVIGQVVLAATTGTISVTTNLAGATFTISGLTIYMGSGTSFTQTNAPTGMYKITYNAVAGYATPLPETKTLVAGGTITFTGTYQGIPVISVSPNPIAFTPTPLNTSSSVQVTVTNFGTASLNIFNVMATSPFFVAPFSASLSPGGQVTINITFAPPRPASFAGTLTITSNASSPTVIIALSGTVLLLPPTGLHATVGNQQVVLYWNPTPQPVDRFNTYRDDGSTVTTISRPGFSQHFLDLGLQNGRLYRYTMTAVKNGIESPPSNFVLARPGEFAVSQPPSPPANPIVFLHGFGFANSAKTWDDLALFLTGTLTWNFGGELFNSGDTISSQFRNGFLNTAGNFYGYFRKSGSELR